MQWLAYMGLGRWRWTRGSAARDRAAGRAAREGVDAPGASMRRIDGRIDRCDDRRGIPTVDRAKRRTILTREGSMSVAHTFHTGHPEMVAGRIAV
jgi:hypothetical protein